MNPMNPVFRFDSNTGINFILSFIFKPCTYLVNLEVKSEISLKLSLHKAFLLPIHFKDLELQISKALLKFSINFIVSSDFENRFKFSYTDKIAKHQLPIGLEAE